MWHWDDNKEQNFTNLRYLDMKKHLTLIADASSKGLGQMKSIYFILNKIFISCAAKSKTRLRSVVSVNKNGDGLSNMQYQALLHTLCNGYRNIKPELSFIRLPTGS